MSYLVILPIDLGDDSNEGKAHDGDEGHLPGHAEHEDEVPHGLDHTPQEHVDVVGDEVTDLGCVRGQAGSDVTCWNRAAVSLWDVG